MVGYVGSAIKQPAAENGVLRYNKVSPAFWSPVCNQMQEEWKGMETRYAAVKMQLCIMMHPLYLSVSLLFTYLCNFSPMRNTSLSRATPPSWPTKDSLMGRGGFSPLWTHGHFTEQPKHLIMKESETSNQCLHFARWIEEHAHSFHWPSDSRLLFLPIHFLKRLNLHHTGGPYWLLPSWDSFQQLYHCPDIFENNGKLSLIPSAVLENCGMCWGGSLFFLFFFLCTECIR